MSVKYLSINDGELVPMDTIKRLSIIDDAERQSLSQLGPNVDAYRFNTRIETADGKKAYAPETVNDIAQQGVGLVSVNEGSFIPAQNILKARNISDMDRSQFQQSTGREMPQAFVAQIDTKAGMVLSTQTAEQVLDSRSRVQTRASKPVIDMAAARDTAMSQSVREPEQPNAPAPTQSIDIN